MKAETKFNVGDKVYTMWNNRISLFTVWAVNVYLSKGDVHPTINYTLSLFVENDEQTKRDEKEVFSTQKEITDFLQKNLY